MKYRVYVDIEVFDDDGNKIEEHPVSADLPFAASVTTEDQDEAMSAAIIMHSAGVLLDTLKLDPDTGKNLARALANQVLPSS